MFSRKIRVLGLILALAACTRAAPDSPAWNPGGALPTQSLPPAFGYDSTPTPSFRFPPTRAPGTPVWIPTPDALHFQPAASREPESYVIQAGDTLGWIASLFGISVETLMQANGLTDPDTLAVGQTLVIPAPTPQPSGPSFKLIPDSELVYGPMSVLFTLDDYIQNKGGYLAAYYQEVNGAYLSGAQIVQTVAQNYSVNPMLLLALLEYRSGWITNPNPDPAILDYPLGLYDDWHAGLYRQLTWTADTLNRGYYQWRANTLTELRLADGSLVPIDATINAGTAGVQYFFSLSDDYPAWLHDTSIEGLFKTYVAMYGYPFDFAIEPLIPPGLTQPAMQLPFPSGETWAFTGGPHGGWDEGSAWAALDFAPIETTGCEPTEAWVVAVADGLITRAANGGVIQDLDGDGYEQTGWVVFYLHIESRERASAGVFLRAGERVGHPSCEGGVADAIHVHLARRFNGEWIPADGRVPFDLDGWISSDTGVEYDGYLTRDGQTVEAFNGSDPINQIQR